MPTEQHTDFDQSPVETEIDFKPGEDASTAVFDQQPVPAEATESDGGEIGRGDNVGGDNARQNQQDVLDAIVPNAEPHVWTIGPPDTERTFVQKPLSFIGKMQWFSLVGNVLDKALSGPQGMSLASLFSAPNRAGQLRAQDFRDADTFVQAISKLVAAAPEFLVDSYMIWLNVPDYDRGTVRELMNLPADEGGLSDDQGMQIIETFLDQNYDALASFFGERLQALQNRVAKLNQLRADRK